MDIVHPRVARLDVCKKIVWAAVRLPSEAPGERKVVVKSFRTFWRQLQKMAAWLAVLAMDASDAALTAPGVYWCPMYHVLAATGIGGVRMQRGAHAQHAGPQDLGTASGSPSCRSSGCCGPASFLRRRWRRCCSAPATART